MLKRNAKPKDLLKQKDGIKKRIVQTIETKKKDGATRDFRHTKSLPHRLLCLPLLIYIRKEC